MTLATTEIKERIREIDAELARAGVPAVGSAEQAQAALGLGCLRTVHRLIERGELRASKIASHWRIRRSEIARLIVLREDA